MAMRCLVLASMLMVVGIVVLGNLSGISAQIDCGGDLHAIAKECESSYVKGGPLVPASIECCNTLLHADVTCFCQNYVTPLIEDLYSIERGLIVARRCGHYAPSGFKCGSYTVPPGIPPMPEK